MESKEAVKEPSKLRSLVKKAQDVLKAYFNCFPKKDPLLEIRPPF